MFSNIYNRKFLAFIMGILVGILIVILILIFDPKSFVPSLPAIFLYFGGVFTTFVTANVVEDGTKAKYNQKLKEINHGKEIKPEDEMK